VLVGSNQASQLCTCLLVDEQCLSSSDSSGRCSTSCTAFATMAQRAHMQIKSHEAGNAQQDTETGTTLVIAEHMQQRQQQLHKRMQEHSTSVRSARHVTAHGTTRSHRPCTEARDLHHLSIVFMNDSCLST